MKKRLSLLMVLMMVLSLVPMSVFATAGTASGGLFSIDDTDEDANKDVTVKLTQATGTKLTTGAEAVLTLSQGKFGTKADQDTTYSTQVKYKGDVVGTITRLPGVKEKAYLKITDLAPFRAAADVMEPAPSTTLIDDVDLLANIDVYFKDRPTTGDVTLAVEEVNDSKIDVAKPIVIGTVKEGTGDDMKVTVKDSATKIGFEGGELSQITIKDIDKNKNTKSLKLELPNSMEWTGSTIVTVGSSRTFTVDGANGTEKYVISGDDKEFLTIDLVPAGSTEAQQLAILKQQVVVKADVKVDKREASKGEISMKVMAMEALAGAGKKAETVTVTVGVLADFDVAITAWEKGKKEIPAMYGGDDTTVKVKMTGVKGSFSDGKDIDFTVTGADIVYDTKAVITPGKGFKKDTVTGAKKDGSKVEDGEFTLTIDGKDLDELEFELKIKAKNTQNGEVKLVAEARDFGKLEANIAKVTPAYTVETKVTSIKKGESLATADIVIKEAKAGLLDSDKFLVLNLKDRNVGTLTFGADYKVEATNGMKLSDGLYDVDGGKKHSLDSLSLEVKTASSKEAATITISNVLVKVDGATVDGEKTIDTYLVEKGDKYTETDKDGNVTKTLYEVKGKDTAVEYALSKEADLDPEYQVKYVNAVKEYGAVATTTVFKIGSKEYTVNGEAKTANEAPFVSGKGYTMLPVKAVAEALGLKADWNAATKTASFSNDSKVATVVIGADTMYVNGTPFKLSAKAEIKNGSTFVELRSLASAFGVKLEWDAATKSVTIQG